MQSTPERFLPILGYEGRYDISDQERVRSWVYWKTSPAPRILKPAPNRRLSSGPYLKVTLTDENRKRTKIFVHHLVAKTFIGPRPEGHYIRHLNGISVDNRLINLAYGTPLENTADSIRHGTQYAVCVLAEITVCLRGHSYDETNTYIKISPSGKPRRQCRACDAWRAREQRRLNPENVRAAERATYARQMARGTTE